MTGNIILIANIDDKPAALSLIENLGLEYDISSSVWSSAHFMDNEPQFSSHQIIISIGGPAYNPVSKQYVGVCKALKDDREIFIYTGFRKAVVYGLSNERSTKTAVSVFIRHYLSDFIKGLK